MRTTSSARRPDATLEYGDRKVIYLLDMSFPHDNNVEEKHREKLTKIPTTGVRYMKKETRLSSGSTSSSNRLYGKWCRQTGEADQ